MTSDDGGVDQRHPHRRAGPRAAPWRSAGGSRPSRPIAKPIRVTVTRSTRITEVRPATAARETSAEAQPRPDLVEGVGDRGARVDVGVVHHADEHERDADVEDGGQREGAEQAERQVAAGPPGLLGEVRDRLEAGVGEEDDGGGGQDAADAEDRRSIPATAGSAAAASPLAALGRPARRDERGEVGAPRRTRRRRR